MIVIFSDTVCKNEIVKYLHQKSHWNKSNSPPPSRVYMDHIEKLWFNLYFSSLSGEMFYLVVLFRSFEMFLFSIGLNTKLVFIG